MTPFPTTANPPTSPRGGEVRHDETVFRDEAQEPLGREPSYDDVLDVAVQYTFPASDPIAVEECMNRHPERDEGRSKGPGATAGHGNFIDL
jgi:hypothetical protein